MAVKFCACDNRETVYRKLKKDYNSGVVEVVVYTNDVIICKKNHGCIRSTAWQYLSFKDFLCYEAIESVYQNNALAV